MTRSGDLPKFENHDQQTTRYTTCYMCACRCGIKVTLEGDQIRFIQGNRRHPVNKGVLCAKGNAGIMKQNSPAKLKNPLLRKSGSERGQGEFEEISWEHALDLLTSRLEKIRASNPNKLAFFTGRDQMQALTGLFAQEFGTINWAAHGGFCSVNMAAAGLYTLGHSFWEFGDPDWERTRYFMLWGVAEDHSSNPIKLGIEQLKRRGAKFVAINPVRTGYQAVADEWIPIKPGTDGMLALAMVHTLLRHELFDQEFLVRYTNAAYLVVDNPGVAGHGMIQRDQQGNPLVFDGVTGTLVSGLKAGCSPALNTEAISADGLPLKTVFMLLADRYLATEYSAQAAAKICGIEADTIERLALEMAHVAFEETITVEVPWTDWTGRRHDRFIGRPVSMHAMRGIAAHSNGFHTCRAIHLLQILLGAIDCPGGHRAKAPYPRHIPPAVKPAKPAGAGQPLASPPLGFPTCPEDLLIDDRGRPLRIDKAYSWEAPIANHGLMHMAITNAVNGDPYPVDTLIFFMANMSWNSTMNTGKIRDLLRERDENGEHRIPFLVVVDAFASEMVSFADLVLPDTTYLERFDCISMLDRPISDPDLIADSIRAPVLSPDRNVLSWAEVLVDLAGRLGLPAFSNDDGSPKFTGYPDFITRYEKSPGIGFLAGWRGANGDRHLKGEPNPSQWQAYMDNECFFQYELPEHLRFYKFVNRDYLEFAHESGFIGSSDPIIIEIYSETLQKFRLAGEGLYPGPQPTTAQDRQRLIDYFDPLPVYYQPLEQEQTDQQLYPFHAITQRPMSMYHSWDSQNAWLRQIVAGNLLYMNRREAQSRNIEDESWVWVESQTGRIRARVKLMEGVHSNTVWTWNAVGKQKGAWGLSDDANEVVDGFLLNHLISELLPDQPGSRAITNSDPVTGQAAWYDLKVNIYPAAEGEHGAWPQFESATPGNNSAGAPSVLRYQSHRAVNIKRAFLDILTRGK